MKEWGWVQQPTHLLSLDTRLSLVEETHTFLAPTLKQQQDFLQGPMTGLREETADKKSFGLHAEVLTCFRRCYTHEESRPLITPPINNWVYILNNDTGLFQSFIKTSFLGKKLFLLIKVSGILADVQ